MIDTLTVVNLMQLRVGGSEQVLMPVAHATKTASLCGPTLGRRRRVSQGHG